ncbi:MAG: hypothetical protein ACOVLB_01675 [Candidatus Nanopelagicus sp.]
MKSKKVKETSEMSMPSAGQPAFNSGRRDDKLEEMSTGITSLGSVASVAAPIGKMQKRNKGSIFAGIQTSEKFPNSKAVKEGQLSEEDIILMPGQGRRLKPGLMSKRADHEVEMARSDLYQSEKDAKQICDMLKSVSERQGLDGWVQAKITKAADYLSSVRKYLEGKSVQANYARQLEMRVRENYEHDEPESMEPPAMTAQQLNQMYRGLGQNLARHKNNPEAMAAFQELVDTFDQIMDKYDAQGVTEEKKRLDPSCWKGYKKQGTKMKGNTRVNNCVPVESMSEGGDSYLKDYDPMKSQLDPKTGQSYLKDYDPMKSQLDPKTGQSYLKDYDPMKSQLDPKGKSYFEPASQSSVEEAAGDPPLNVPQGWQSTTQPDGSTRISKQGTIPRAEYQKNMADYKAQNWTPEKVSQYQTKMATGGFTGAEKAANYQQQQQHFGAYADKPLPDTDIDEGWKSKLAGAAVTTGIDMYAKAQEKKKQAKQNASNDQSVKEGSSKMTPREKFNAGLKRQGFDPDAAAKRLENILAKQKAERIEHEKKYGHLYGDDKKIDEAEKGTSTQPSTLPNPYKNSSATPWNPSQYPSQTNIPKRELPKNTSAVLGKNDEGNEDETVSEEKAGLWANIHAKRERIKHGSGERMRKPGSKGAPTAAALKKSAKE